MSATAFFSATKQFKNKKRSPAKIVFLTTYSYLHLLADKSAGFILSTRLNNAKYHQLLTLSKDEPIWQQLEIHLQHLSQHKKAAKPCVRACAIAMAAIYEATEPTTVDFDYVCDCCPKFNKAIALLQDLSRSGLLAVAKAITEELAVLEQLQGAGR